MTDTDKDRELAEFVERCRQAMDTFHLWVLDADHQPVETRDIIAWGRFKEAFPNNCRVDLTDVDDLTVSTVFLGYDVGYSEIRGGQPILFETMIFGPGLSEVADRYATWDEAVAGHAEIVRQQRSKVVQFRRSPPGPPGSTAD